MLYVFITPIAMSLTLCATGKRISQKLLRNIVKFLSIINDVLKIAPMEYLKQSSDEVELRGPESKYDSRKLNSYPSKVKSGSSILCTIQEFSGIYVPILCCIYAHSKKL